MVAAAVPLPAWALLPRVQAVVEALQRGARPSATLREVGVKREPETVAGIEAAAEAWFDHQVEKLQQVHGASWPKYEAWLVDYLKEELRQRLDARGWRRRHEQ